MLEVSKSATPTINEVLKGKFHFDVIYQDIIRCYFVVKYNSLPYFCGCLASYISTFLRLLGAFSHW